jgi:thioesterase domain-containing protein
MAYIERAMFLTAMAAVHCELLRTIQPVGPYLLTGWSFGGVLAFELAWQIQVGGGQVECLGLIDGNHGPRHHQRHTGPRHTGLRAAERRPVESRNG